MFKSLALSCLLAVSAQCLPSPNPAVPYYPQPYPVAYPQAYAVQPKYNVQPAFVAPYSPAGYRQVYVPANPAYNPYYYGYAPYPGYPQQYGYQYAQNDGTQAPAAPAPSGWGEYLNSIWNYVPNYPFGSTESQSTSEAESGAGTGAASSAESSATAEASPGKGDKPTEGQKTEVPKTEQQPASNDQAAQAPFKQPFAPTPFAYFGQPQYYGQVPYQQAVYDPSKLNAANNGAVSSFLFSRNQPQPAYQQPQPFADQKYFQGPSSAQSYQGTAALAYQRYLQNQKQPIQGQYQQQPNQQFQQDQPSFQPQQQQLFQQEQPSFQPQQPTSQQQYDQQTQQDASSVVVDSNASGVQVNAEGQQKPQSKLATGSN